MGEKIDQTTVMRTITRFLKGKLMEVGMSGYVVGLSGGIDSALSAALAAQAVGPDKVMGVLMPYRTSSKSSVQDALKLIDKLGIEYRQVDITPMIDAYFPDLTDENRLRAGNKMARERMAILFDIAHELGCLVLGTGNRTEICLGYTTWHGDSACSLNPIGQLYKGEVRSMARELGVPESIIDKAPSADLWQGQTDENEIGVTYDQIDAILRRIIDDGELSLSRLESEGFDVVDVSRVVSLTNRNAFKRTLPDVPDLGKVSIPTDIGLEE